MRNELFDLTDIIWSTSYSKEINTKVYPVLGTKGLHFYVEPMSARLWIDTNADRIIAESKAATGKLSRKLKNQLRLMKMLCFYCNFGYVHIVESAARKFNYWYVGEHNANSYIRYWMESYEKAKASYDPSIPNSVNFSTWIHHNARINAIRLMVKDLRIKKRTKSKVSRMNSFLIDSYDKYILEHSKI